MNKPSLLRTSLFLLLLTGLAFSAACSKQDPAPAPATTGAAEPAIEPAAEPITEPAAETQPAATEIGRDQVVVIYGKEEMIPWLEAENWWGEVKADEPVTVPHVIITAIHPSWVEFASQMPVSTKKALFYRLMLPLVMHANEMAMNFRQGLIDAREAYRADGAVPEESMGLIRRLAHLLPDMTEEDVNALTADYPEMESMLDALLYRVDVVPAGLALGQAAYESGYGTSRFAVEGNSLFGQWTYKGDGLKPKEQRTASKGDHRIKTFEWPFDSVRGYFINLFTHPAYEDFRRLRAELRESGKPMDSMTLADGLLRYSERGQEYVDSLKGIMRVNHLTVADKAVFRDEPIRFLLSEQSPEDVEKVKKRLQQAEESGELAEIYARMRLE